MLYPHFVPSLEKTITLIWLSVSEGVLFYLFNVKSSAISIFLSKVLFYYSVIEFVSPTLHCISKVSSGGGLSVVFKIHFILRAWSVGLLGFVI